MDYRFREIRKGERADVLGFAAALGCSIEPTTLHHHLSLGVHAEGEMVAAVLCVERDPRRFVIEILVADDGCDRSLVTELADRCLRKVQSEAIGSARLSSPTAALTDAIWSDTNWLDRIEETPPPGALDVDEASHEPAAHAA
ncbi:MAG: hypothetical protein ACPGYV_08420 [Phycisphaeraceae bacterium]